MSVTMTRNERTELFSYVLLPLEVCVPRATCALLYVPELPKFISFHKVVLLSSLMPHKDDCGILSITFI